MLREETEVLKSGVEGYDGVRDRFISSHRRDVLETSVEAEHNETLKVLSTYATVKVATSKPSSAITSQTTTNFSRFYIDVLVYQQAPFGYSQSHGFLQ